MDDSVEIRVRLPADLQDRVDAIAQVFDQPRSWVIERAVESFVDIENIKRALAEADAGDFATDGDVDAFFARWRPARDAG